MSAHRAATFFSDSVLLMTGGDTGVGLAIAPAFTAAGAHVFITGQPHV